MINGTVILLTYYYDPEDRNLPLLRYVKNYLGVYLPFDLYLYEPLKMIFSNVIIYDYLKRRTEVGVRAVNEEIIDLVRKEKPKYVLWTSWQYDIHESTFEEIRKESIVVGWFFDDDWRFDDYSKWWIPYLDYCVTNAADALPKYRELNARVILTVPNTGIAIDRDWSKTEEKYDVSFVGSRDCADRKHFINILKKNRVPVKVFGDGWGGYVSFEEMIDIFKTSKINLNFSKDVAFHGKLQIKGRIFQVCMAGGFMLTEYAPGIEEFFEIDKEIVCFRDAKEMTGKIAYYLEHDKERRDIARAGWERARQEYTSSSMVAGVFREIEIDMAAKGKHARSAPPKMAAPAHIRNIRARYHFQWARALLEENARKDLWEDALALSSEPYGLRPDVIYYRIASSFPSSMRPVLLKPYKILEKLHDGLVSILGSIITLRKMKARLNNKPGRTSGDEKKRLSV